MNFPKIPVTRTQANIQPVTDTLGHDLHVSPGATEELVHAESHRGINRPDLLN